MVGATVVDGAVVVVVSVTLLLLPDVFVLLDTNFLVVVDGVVVFVFVVVD